MKQTAHFDCKRLADYKSEHVGMSKKIIKVVALVLVAAVLGMGLALSPQVYTSHAQATGAAKGTARNSAIIATTAAVLK